MERKIALRALAMTGHKVEILGPRIKTLRGTAKGNAAVQDNFMGVQADTMRRRVDTRPTNKVIPEGFYRGSSTQPLFLCACENDRRCRFPITAFGNDANKNVQEYKLFKELKKWQLVKKNLTV